ncbi:MAG TPA: amino acid deaminase [Terracidiphilus sp.]|nr:amino acid deaminase [Terracidiphilus sp.]
MNRAMNPGLSFDPTNHSTIDPLNKGIGAADQAFDPAQAAALGWNLLREDLSLPAAVLYKEKLEHNLRWMQEFVRAYGVKLAPHGKTTMAPRLFEMQLEHGAWGITLATAHQTLVAWRHGVRRVLMANQLVGRRNMAIVSELLADPGFAFYCLVDSADLVDLLSAYFAERGQRLNVLLELGVEGGRAGVRNGEQMDQVLAAIERSNGAVVLSGVEVYEGVLNDEAQVRELLKRAVDSTRRLIGEGRFGQSPVLLSGAGSTWYDVVAEEFSAAGLGPEVEIVLRPGCYLTHDAGHYREAQARILGSNRVAREIGSDLECALHIWAYIQSVPEPGRAIVGLGRRDAAFDSGLPVPALYFRPGRDVIPAPAPAGWRLTRIMDQHAFLDVPPGDEVRPGEMVGFNICHPCLTFDKWRVIPVVDSEYRVIEAVQTYF